MPVSEVSVCNSALLKIGAERISSLTEDTRSAILCNALFDQVRDSVLRAHPWNFAIRRAALNPTATTPAYEYDYEYDLPNDCLKVLDTENSADDYVIEGRKILTNIGDLKIRYIYQNKDPGEWDACFAEALAARLARELAYALTQSAALVDVCDRAYKAAIAEARSMDGSEGIIKALEPDTWIDSRR